MRLTRGRLTRGRLDFVVIGAQKAGTTSLWRYLEDNDGLRMPQHKEAPFFSEGAYPGDLGAYLRALFADAPRRARLGTVTPTYMHGTPGVPVPEIAARIHATVPGVRLVALLRDPVERAASAHRMAVRDYGERRTFPEAVSELLAPDALERDRSGPEATSSYIVAGEYGRMLSAYLELFPPDQLHVELTDDLERDPSGVVERVCRFIGVAPHEPRSLGERFFASGSELVPPEAAADLRAYLDRYVWPRMRHPHQHRVAFEQWFRLWNVARAEPEPVDAEAAARLREHYADDAARLAEAAGIRPPWAA